MCTLTTCIFYFTFLFIVYLCLLFNIFYFFFLLFIIFYYLINLLLITFFIYGKSSLSHFYDINSIPSLVRRIACI